MKRLYLVLATVAWSVTTLTGCSGSGNPRPDTPPVNPAPDGNGQQAKVSDGDLLAGFQNQRIGDDAAVNKDADSLVQAALHVGDDPWNPKSNGELVRDAAGEVGARVYRNVGPSVVVVKTKTGHGTGSIIDERGWILTNHHVIASGTETSSGAKMATIYLGKLVREEDSEMMVLETQGYPAIVHRSSKEKDMALLHIIDPKQKFPALKLAAKTPPAQHACYAIGHPKSGLLWTIRRGQITQVGMWPRDGVGMLAKRVSASPTDMKEMENTLAKSPQMKILLSNCGINSGDSGGPLVNEDGELISVTFAMPSDPGTTSFAYHIHLDEVKKFLAVDGAVPSTDPIKLVSATQGIDPWPTGAFMELRDLDGDGLADALGIADKKGGALTGVLLDLRQENKIKTLAELGDQPKKWRYQLAIQFRPQLTAYYDTQMNGTIDLIMTEQPGGSVQIKRLEKGQWTSEDGGRRPVFDAILFPDRTVRDRLTLYAKKLQEK